MQRHMRTGRARNAAGITQSNLRVTGNDRRLVGGACTLFVPPDDPAGEGFDCGEAVHLTGVSHSIVESTIVEGNSGGVLLSDDSGPTHDNLITERTVGAVIWTEDMFIQAIRTGNMGTSRPILPPMPWQEFSQMSDVDLKAIYAYLRTIPAVVNHVPEPEPPAGASH